MLLSSRAARAPRYHNVLLPPSPSIADRLQAVETRIQQAAARAGRNRADITLVAVSKKFSAHAIVEAYEAGVRDFGENYVQEFAEKKEALGGLRDVRYHFIGHLQTNKARLASELFDVIETVDSVKVVKRLEPAGEERRESLEVLLEVKLSNEASKTGAAPDELSRLLEQAERCRGLFVSGLMTMPPWSPDAEASRPYFRQLAELARKYHLPKLSMGMSNDLEVAIEEGATILRVGTALFGPRPKPVPSEAAP